MTTEAIEARGAVVLCGGGSTRMGRDKALLPFGDEVMLQRTVRLLGEVVPQRNILIVASPGQAMPLLPETVEVVRDEDEGLGPLPAIAAGLNALRTRAESAIVTGCDAPLLKPAAVSWLFQRLDEASLQRGDDRSDGVVLQDAERLYSLFAVYRTSAAGGFTEAFESGIASMRTALRSGLVNMQFINVEELREVDSLLESLVNCNTPEEYQRTLQLVM